MTLNVNLTRRVDDRIVESPLENVVFLGGEPALYGLVTFTLDGEEMVARIVSFEPEMITVEQIDERALTEELPVTFTLTGVDPPQAAPDTDKLDLAAPSRNLAKAE